MNEGETKIEVAGLSKSFGDNRVLEEVALAVPAGESAVIIGPAASGKSVLLKCVVGLYPPDRGSIRVDGKDLSEVSGHERADLVESMGMLFQQGPGLL